MIMSSNGDQLLVVLNNLPKELEQVELDALICGLISAYIGFEEVPAYLEYLHFRTLSIQQARGKTKH
jgi:hypothetical protein